ncbi:MAG: gamma-glutamylcyclotransferase family protein [Hylemonella sp.]|nr:gamma-glutamylcyclotransferase family protein [Hylemonella sp.]
MTAQPERHVFVYGTLRRGEANDINRLQPAPLCLGPARIRGVLYDLGPYPGMILGGADWVYGEVYAIAAELERQLDAIEEVAPVPSGEYARRYLDVELDGRRLGCLVYEINAQRVQGRPRIASGDWLRRH